MGSFREGDCCDLFCEPVKLLLIISLSYGLIVAVCPNINLPLQYAKPICCQHAFKLTWLLAWLYIHHYIWNVFHLTDLITCCDLTNHFTRCNIEQRYVASSCTPKLLYSRMFYSVSEVLYNNYHTCCLWFVTLRRGDGKLINTRSNCSLFLGSYNYLVLVNYV